VKFAVLPPSTQEGESLMNEYSSPEVISKPPQRPPLAKNVGSMERLLSVAAGSVLVAFASRRLRSPLGATLLAAGGEMLFRGATGFCPVYKLLNVDTHEIDEVGVGLRAAVTINQPAEVLYERWRDLASLPEIMSHLEAVTVLDERRSHWVAKAPAGLKAEWDAEIVQDDPNELIAWRSTENAQIFNTGSVKFLPAPGGRGTEVHVFLRYAPPAGSVGVAIAKLFGEEPTQQLIADLIRFKQKMEAGEIPTVTNQPSGKSVKRQVKSHLLATAESSQTDAKPHNNGSGSLPALTPEGASA
jgi:uncharacterized membrane protein